MLMATREWVPRRPSIREREAMSQGKAQSLLVSSVTLKIVMAITGVAMVGFVVIHMLGHLIVFQGRVAYNDYAEFLQGLGGLKWIARFGLLGMIGAHIAAATALTNRNQRARPEGYVKLRSRRTTFAAKSMWFAGLAIFFALLYHLAHFTLGWVDAEQYTWIDEFGRHDLYSHFVISFEDPRILGTYLAFVVFVCMHLSHGVTSMFKTMGLSRGRFTKPIEMIGPVVAIILFLGFAAPPLACMMGVVTAG